jgi:hypothetical protein
MLLEVLPSSPASMALLDEITRLAIANVHLAVIADDEHPPMRLVRAVAARVLELRGPLAATSPAERSRWASMVPFALEVARDVRAQRAEREAA